MAKCRQEQTRAGTWEHYAGEAGPQLFAVASKRSWLAGVGRYPSAGRTRLWSGVRLVPIDQNVPGVTD